MYWFHVIDLSLINVMLAISLNLILGYGGMASMAHAAFFGIGGYVSGLISIHMGWNFIWGMLIGIFVSGIIAGLIALPFIRIRDEYLILFTLAFQMVYFHVLMAFYKVTGGDSGLVDIRRPQLFSIRFTDALSYIPLLAFFVILFLIVSFQIAKSPFGLVLKAIREDEKAAVSLGKNVIKFKIIIFVIGSSIASSAGSLYAHYSIYVSPNIFTLDLSILIIVMVVLGGLANLWGSILGALLLTVIPESLTFLPGASEIVSPLRLCVFGGLLIIFMRYRPEGMIPEYARMRKRKNVNYIIRKEEGNQFINRNKYQVRTIKNDSEDVIVEAINISKRFGGILAVRNLSIKLRKGKITAIVGPNGCGKTTVFNLITRFIDLDKGRIEFNGREISRAAPHELPKVGLVRSWQEVRIFKGMTVLDNVLLSKQMQLGENIFKIFFRPRLIKAEKAKIFKTGLEYLKLMGLQNKADEVAKNLSYAEQKLLAIARLLATEAEVILLDEPSSGIDPAWVRDFLKLIRNLAKMGKTICIVEHNLDVIRGVADIVYFMAGGEVISQGSVEELMSDPKLGEIYFGEQSLSSWG